MEHRTVKRLRQVKLSPLAQWYEPWRRDPANLEKSHDAFVEEICAVLEQSTEQGRIRRLLARARLPLSVCQANVDVGRGVTAAQLANLCTGSWTEDGHNLVIWGPEGSGKSFLAGALAREIVRHTPRVNWLSLGHLPLESWDLDQPKIQQLVSPYRTGKLLVLDGFADSHIPAGAGKVLKAVLDARTQRNLSTLITSSRPIEDWDRAFKDVDVANAIFECIFRKAKMIDLGERHLKPSSCPRRRPRSTRTPVTGTADRNESSPT